LQRCSHQTGFLGSKYTKLRLRSSGVFRAHGTCLVAANFLPRWGS